MKMVLIAGVSLASTAVIIGFGVFITYALALVVMDRLMAVL